MSGTTGSSEVDLLVVGSGSAGAALAAFAAERGLKTLVLERKPLDRAGACWVNDVPGWMFDEAGVARPTGDELYASRTLTLVAGFETDAPRVRAVPRDLVGVDMRKLVARLEERATRAGAELRGDAHVHTIEEEGSRVVVRSSLGTHHARFVVDASGLAGVEALGPLHGRTSDVCTAAQEVRELRDPAAAHAFFEEHRAREGDVLVFSGVAGGYSIVNVRLHDDHVLLLTGSIAADGHRSGRALLDDFAASHAWIGERVFGGARAIPLAFPRPIVARGRIAAIGDAASQVFSAHGSGTGAGLVAARMVADALVRERLADYQHRYQKTYGHLLATHDLFRRFTQRCSQADVRVMIGEGLLSPKAVEASLSQRFPGFERGLLRRGRTLLRHPHLGRSLAELGARTAALAAVYAAHPDDPARQSAWAARVARLMK